MTSHMTQVFTRSPRSIALLSLLLLSSSARGGFFSDPPNAVVICLDTVRKDTFDLPEATRSRDSLSPWLARALRFENARSRSPSSWTAPAVASTLTGLYPIQHRAGLYTKQPASLGKDVPPRLDSSVVTLPELLPKHTVMAFTESPFLMPRFGLLQRGPAQFARGGTTVTSALRWLNTEQAKGPFFSTFTLNCGRPRRRRA